jgi:hypothetical protein
MYSKKKQNFENVSAWQWRIKKYEYLIIFENPFFFIKNIKSEKWAFRII